MVSELLSAFDELIGEIDTDIATYTKAKSKSTTTYNTEKKELEDD